MESQEHRFVPCTREISIGRGVVYRLLRSWSSGTFAGEGLESVGLDRSGCIVRVGLESVGLDCSGCIVRVDDRILAYPPKTVMHRAYWAKGRMKETWISAFLSYPRAMGAMETYFWEAYIGAEPERFVGPKAEERMEAKILRRIGNKVRK